MVIARGEIWWADLPDPVGSGPGYRRPILIVQSDTFNQSRLPTFIGVTLTTNLALAWAPGNVLLSRKQTHLRRDSVAIVSQIVTFDQSVLLEKAGWVSSLDMQQIDHGLRLALDL